MLHQVLLIWFNRVVVMEGIALSEMHYDAFVRVELHSPVVTPFVEAIERGL